jgi:hypothetical protein
VTGDLFEALADTALLRQKRGKGLLVIFPHAEYHQRAIALLWARSGTQRVSSKDLNDPIKVPTSKRAYPIKEQGNASRALFTYCSFPE